MTNIEPIDFEEEEKPPKRRPKLRVIQGGKGPPEPPTEDWLGPLKMGVRFLARPRNWNSPELVEYLVSEKAKNATKLVIYLQQPVFSWEDNVRFSKAYEKIETLGKRKSIFEDFINGNNNRPLPS